jgi:hypothetical protein
MDSTKPIACTLTSAELRDRGAAWQKLFASGLLHRDSIPGGIMLRAEPGAWNALTELIDLERECCAWIDFEVTGHVVKLTAAGDGADVLAGMFEPAAKQ